MLEGKYYSSLLKSFNSPFREFLQIIDLDVRRTRIAIENPVIYRSMTNILLSYAKYASLNLDGIPNLDTAKV